MGRVIVHDDVDAEVGQHLRVDLLEEGEQLRGAMPLVAFADDKPEAIQRCEREVVPWRM